MLRGATPWTAASRSSRSRRATCLTALSAGSGTQAADVPWIPGTSLLTVAAPQGSLVHRDATARQSRPSVLGCVLDRVRRVVQPALQRVGMAGLVPTIGAFDVDLDPGVELGEE